ncbi:MAG: TFIIB-type zinc ribbon-containing protein [Gammaproteobacteria bacterium]
MAQCNSCAAPLPANTHICLYCGTHNDVDLTNKYDFVIHHEASNRICPHCNEPLQTVAISLDGKLFIERCEQCFGLFFDVNEIERLLESAVTNVFTINRDLLVNINKERYRHQKIKYIKCPVCHSYMSRINFGHRSGVVVDRCKTHGIWLDNGEITHLLEWKKAGGQLLHAKQSQNIKLRHHSAGSNSSTNLFETSHQDQNLLTDLASVISQLFDG